MSILSSCRPVEASSMNEAMATNSVRMGGKEYVGHSTVVAP